MSNEIEAKIRRVISESIDLITPMEQVGLDDNLLQLGMDSINIIKVIINIESEFGFEFTDEDLNMENFRNIRNLVEYVQGRGLTC